MILLPLLLVPVVFCMALVRLYRIPTRLLRSELRAPEHRWGWMLAYPVVNFLTAWVFFYRLKQVVKTA